MIHDINQGMAHGTLRNKVSDDFANILAGNKKEWAKLTFLEINRGKNEAYIDFEEKWALDKAVAKGEIIIDGVPCKITAGRGGRRTPTGARGPKTGGPGGQQRQQGGGPNAGERRTGPGAQGAQVGRGGHQQGQGQGQGKTSRVPSGKGTERQ